MFSSFQACEPGSRFRRARFYRRAESRVRAGGRAWTVLRSGLYAEFVAAHGTKRWSAGRLELPWERGRVAWIGRDDIARGLAAACLQAGHEGRVCELTGRRALSMDEVAMAVSEATGRPVEFVPITPEAYAASCRALGLPGPVAAVWLSVWRAIEAGELERVTDHLERLTGRPPLPMLERLRRLASSERGSS